MANTRARKMPDIEMSDQIGVPMVRDDRGQRVDQPEPFVGTGQK